MGQYIDKASVVAEIERRINEINSDIIEDWRYRLQREHDVEVMKNILSLINTLEVKEMSNIWHTISDNDADLPKVGDIICCIINGRVISGEYRLNKFYGKVYDGYDNPIEKGDKWCFLSDFLNSVVETKEVGLNEEIESYFKGFGKFASVGIDDCIDIAKHFFELGLKAKDK